MTHRRRNTLLAAVGLCATGLVLLLFNFDVFMRYEPAAQYLAGALILLASLSSFVGYARARRRSNEAQWWRLIPGWILLALAGMVVLSTLPGAGPRLNGALLFGGLAAAFLHVFLLRPQEFWWAIIPGGFMLVLGSVIGISSIITRIETLGALLFGGMGAVFFALYLLGDRRQWWALMPGSILVLFGFFVLTWDQNGGEGSGALLRWWPIIFIMAGIWLALRGPGKGQPPADKMEIHSAPPRRRKQAAPESSAAKSETVVASARRKRIAEDGASASAPGTSIEILPDLD